VVDPYPPAWREVEVKRVGTTQVDILVDKSPVGLHTDAVSTKKLPVRFSAWTFSSGADAPLSIEVDWVEVTE